MYVVGNYENYADFGGIFENQKGYNSYLVRYDPALTPITSRTVTWAVPNAVEVEYRDYYTTGEAIILGYSNIASFWSVSMLNNWTTTAPATESYYDIHLDRIDDKLYVTGADFSTLSTVVVREVDPSNGSLGWAEYSSYGTGNAKDYGKGVAALDGEDFVFATGSYTGNIIFGSTTSHWSSSGGSSDDIFTCRVHKGTAAFAKNDPGTPVIPKSDEALPAISVYPNPSTGEFTIRFGNADGEGTASLEISSVTGQILISKQYSLFKGLNKLTLNASNLSSGIYFISVKYNDYSVTKKVMISKD